MTYYFCQYDLSKQDKEEMVVRLLNEGITFKEIAKQVHMSLSDTLK